MDWQVETLRSIVWEDIEKKQKSLAEHVKRHPTSAFLLFSEPLPTFTCGRSGTTQDLIWTKDILEKQAASIATVSRGGKWTYHGPGQMLVYPIADLHALGYHSKSARSFVETFRASLLAYLRSLDITAENVDSPFGIFANGKKLVSFGFDFQDGIVTHGAALYITNQNKWFTGINPCGTPGQEFTSLQELGKPFAWTDVMAEMLDFIKKGLNPVKKPLL